MFKTALSKSLCALNQITDKTFSLPMVSLVVTWKCNCKCLMCDYWKNKNIKQMDVDMVRKILPTLKKYHTIKAMITGGEPLLNENVFDICTELKRNGIGITLVTNGSHLQEHITEIADNFDEIYVSIHSNNAKVHNDICGTDIFSEVIKGIRIIKDTYDTKIIARTVIQKRNFLDIIPTIELVKSLGVDKISFLPIDIKTPGFGRDGDNKGRYDDLTLNTGDIKEFESIVGKIKRDYNKDLKNGVIETTSSRFDSIIEYFKALLGSAEPPRNNCIWPWTSLVIEPNGEVRPCFFHNSFANLNKMPLDGIVNSNHLRKFRQNKKHNKSVECAYCVSPLEIKPRGLRINVSPS